MQGIETSYYLQEKKSIEMLLVRATEHSTMQTESLLERARRCGVISASYDPLLGTWILLEWRVLEGDNPVRVTEKGLVITWVTFTGYWTWIWEASTPNIKYILKPIANEYSDGKLKSTLNRKSKDPETY